MGRGWQPEGFDKLPARREEKVRLGNSHAHAAARFVVGQEKAMHHWISRLYKSTAALVAKAFTYLVSIDVCVYGASWRKPTNGLCGRFRVRQVACSLM